MRFRRPMLVLSAIVFCAPAALHAQSEDGTQPGYTLHVYANRLQVPTLVLDNVGRPVPKLTRDRFRISLDDGPAFAPSLVRQEGQDPITLSIVLDAGGDENTMFPRLAAAFQHLPANVALQPHDHISVYALDCSLFRSLDDSPANTAALEPALANALATPRLHGDAPKGTCRRSVRLDDFLAYIALQMKPLPGRRILLLVSEGRDAASKITLNELEHIVTDSGVAVFVLRDRFTHDGYRQSVPDAPDGRGGIQHVLAADPINAVASRSGGLVFNTSPAGIRDKLTEMLTDIRSRYILEFPRPDSDEAGLHGIDVTVPSLFNPTIRTAGVSAPLPDPAVLNDPNTVRSAPSPAVYGPHRPTS